MEARTDARSSTKTHEKKDRRKPDTRRDSSLPYLVSAIYILDPKQRSGRKKHGVGLGAREQGRKHRWPVEDADEAPGRASHRSSAKRSTGWLATRTSCRQARPQDPRSRVANPLERFGEIVWRQRSTRRRDRQSKPETRSLGKHPNPSPKN